MKKITTLFSALVFTAFGWQASAQLTEDFESGTFPPAGWTEIQVTGTNNWSTNTGNNNGSVATANGGTLNAMFVNSSSVADINKLVSPSMDLSTGPAFDLTFWYTQVDWSGDQDTLGIYYKTSAAGAWVYLASYTSNIAVWTQEVLSLPNLSNDYYIAFEGSAMYGRGITIDDVTVAPPPSCPAPTALTVSNITTTSVDLGWTSAASTWDIEYGVAPYTATGTPTITGTTANPHNLTGLTPNTSYEYYVRADCGGSGTSTWSGPYSFFTGYCQVVSTNTSSYTDDFSTTSGATNIANLTSGYATNGYEDATSMVVSQYATASVDFTAGFVGTTVGFNIWIDWNNDLDFDDVGEDVYASGGYVSSAAGTITVPVATPVGNYRMRIRCDFNAASPNSCDVSGNGRNETEDYTFTVIATPTCLPPTGLTATNILGTSVDLGWTSAASTWDIEYGVAPYTATGTPTVAGTTNNPHSLSGLTASTTYEYYVRADCGAGDLSTWSGPFSFVTACAIFTAPYLETFDAATTPLCWSQSTTSGGPWEFGQLGSADYAAANFAENTGNGGYYAWVDFSGTDAGVILELPVVDVSALSNAELSFAFASNNDLTNDSNELYVEAWDGSAWNQVGMIQQDSSLWIMHTYSLASFTYATNLTKIRFRAERDPNATVNAWYNNDLLIDDVKIDDPVITSVFANEGNINLSVYPNPNNGVFTLNVNATDVSELTIKVMNMQGQVIFTKNNFDNMNNVNEQIDLSNNANGIYFVTVTTDKGVVTHKVVVQ